MEAYYIDTYDCSEVEAYWEILRSDGDIVVYTVLNDDYSYGRNEYLPDKGLQFDNSCYCSFECYFNLEIRPIDLRYNGVQITGVINMPQCFRSQCLRHNYPQYSRYISAILSYHLGILFSVCDRFIGGSTGCGG